MLFIIETANNKQVLDFVAKTKERMQDPSKGLGVNEQDCFVKPNKEKDTLWTYVFISPRITNIMLYLGVIVLLPMLVFTGLTLWLIFPAGLMMLKFFETKWFGFCAFFLGLRKAGYKGSIKLVSTEELLLAWYNEAKRNIR